MPEAVPQAPAAAVPQAPRKFVLPPDPAPAPAAPTPQAELPLATPTAEAGESQGQDTAEQAPATATDGDKPPVKPTGQDPDKAEKQNSRRFERRLDKAYRRAAEAEARATLLNQQLEEARKATAAPADPAAPRLEQFDDIEKYATAKAEYEAGKRLKEHQDTQRKQAQTQAEQRLVESWEERIEQAIDKYEDFSTVVGELKPTHPWSRAIMKAENGADVAYHLGKNLKEAQRISALEPIEQILEIGKLAAKLAAQPAQPKTPSKAPAPINPLTGSTPVVSDVPGEGEDIGTWIKKRQKQVYASRK